MNICLRTSGEGIFVLVPLVHYVCTCVVLEKPKQTVHTSRSMDTAVIRDSFEAVAHNFNFASIELDSPLEPIRRMERIPILALKQMYQLRNFRNM